MLALVFVTLLQTPAASPIETPLETIDRGARSMVDSPRQLVVRTPEEWSALWRAHSPNRPAPAVDFAAKMAVAVFLGVRSTGGYAVDIVRTREERGALVVEYIEKRPSPDAIVAQVLTSPFHIVAMTARTGEVRFEKVPK